MRPAADSRLFVASTDAQNVDAPDAEIRQRQVDELRRGDALGKVVFLFAQPR